MAKPSMPTGIFKPNPSRQESRADTTTTVARTIAQAEIAAREAKTARLRKLRLQKEAETAEQPAPKKRAVRAKAR